MKQLRCGKCGGEKFRFEKQVGGKPGKEIFQYFAICETCQFRRTVPRSKEIFEKVKPEQWKYSKHYARLYFKNQVAIKTCST